MKSLNRPSLERRCERVLFVYATDLWKCPWSPLYGNQSVEELESFYRTATREAYSFQMHKPQTESNAARHSSDAIQRIEWLQVVASGGKLSKLFNKFLCARP